jgi:Flp pilus assembly protein TadD
MAYNSLGLALHDADRSAKAEVAYRKALELGPNRNGTSTDLSVTLLAQGRAEEAVAEARRDPDEAIRLWAVAIVQHARGQRAKSDEALRELTAKYAADSAFQIAAVHAARGETEAAFEWLERAYAQRDGGLAMMRTSPCLRSLHGDPRWGAFLRKMGFVG